MKKKILGIQITNLIFCGLLFTIALLQKNNIIGSDKRLIAIYIISILLYWIVMSIFIIVLMHKNKDEGFGGKLVPYGNEQRRVPGHGYPGMAEYRRNGGCEQ